MQITGSQKKRVALFFIVGVLMFLSIVGVLVGNQLLKREECFYTRFKDVSVAGLTEGSSVKFQGMNIGHVSEISIDREDTSVVRIDLCLKPGVPVKEGTFTQLGNIGITGLKFVELQGGGKGKKIPVNGEIPSQKSTWDTITGKASVIATKLEQILNQINNRIEDLDPNAIKKIVSNVSGITSSMDTILKSNRNEITSIVKRTDVLLANINENMDNIKQITGDVRRMTSKEGPINNTLVTVEETAKEIQTSYKNTDINKRVDKIFDLIDSMQKTMDTVNITLMRSREDITDSFDNLSEGMTNFNEFTRIIMENPSTIIRGSEEETQ
jgi:phospholipid/cholesterol/gamma-HCH transport system substrate-binding protein